MVCTMPHYFLQDAVASRMEDRECRKKTSTGGERDDSFGVLTPEISEGSRLSKYFVGPRTRALLQEALSDLGVAGTREESAAGAFHSDSLQPISTGTLSSMMGSSLGFPAFFEHPEGSAGPTDQELERVCQRNIITSFLTSRHKGWQPLKGDASSSPLSEMSANDKEELRRSFVHSEEAKRFAVTMELQRCQTRHTISISTAPFVCFAGALFAAAGADQLLSSWKRTAVGYSVPGRVVLFAACFAAQAALSVKAVNYALERSEDASLRALAASSSSRLEELRRGAAAYAEECRRRGKLLRRLAPGGEKHFDERGDPVRPFLGARQRTPEEVDAIFREAEERRGL